MTEQRFALIIANYQFEDKALSQLVAPPQDAKALAGVLEDADIGGFQVRTLLNKSTQIVNKEIEAFFANRQRNDLLLLYFSGHGIKDDRDGQLYFASYDTQSKPLVYSTAVSAAFVNKEMSLSRSKRQVLLLDCCYGGAFARGTKEAIQSIDIKECFQGHGRVVITATDAMHYAFEGDEIEGEGVHSIFTRILVKGLETGEADLDGDGLIVVDDTLRVHL